MEHVHNDEIIDYIEKAGLIFNPTIYYEGEYPINSSEIGSKDFLLRKDAFYINSKSDNGVNLYDRFVSRYFYDKIACMADEKKNADIKKYLKNRCIPVILSSDKDSKSRYIRFSNISMLINIVDTYYFQYHEMPITEEELLVFTRNFLREKRAMYEDVLKNGKRSIYYDTLSERLEYSLGKNALTYNFAVAQIDILNLLIVSLRGAKDISKDEFKVAEFKECFDIDKLYLLIMKNILEQAEADEKAGNTFNHNFSELETYLNIISEIDKDYNPEIKYYKNGKLVSFTVKDLARRSDALIKNHPEYKVISIDLSIAVEASLSDADHARMYMDHLQESEALLSNWVFIDKGDGISKRKQTNKEYTRGKGVSKNADIEKRLAVFLATPYKYQIQGKNTFAGYVGFIYPNGNVLFERFYTDEECQKPVKEKSNATYLMRIDNFVELSKMTKPEIIKMISSGSDKVKRFLHTKGWSNRISKVAEGVDYDDEVVDIIDGLLKNNDLSKKRVKDE